MNKEAFEAGLKEGMRGEIISVLNLLAAIHDRTDSGASFRGAIDYVKGLKVGMSLEGIIYPKRKMTAAGLRRVRKMLEDRAAPKI